MNKLPFSLYESLRVDQKKYINLVCLALNNLVSLPFYVGYIFKETYLYRATGFSPSCVKDIGYPPLSRNPSLGRCNYEGNPVFYASSSVGGALMEKSRIFKGNSDNKEESIFLSRWKTIVPFAVAEFHLKSLKNTKNEALRNYIIQEQNIIKNSHPNSELIIKCLNYCCDNFSINGSEAYPFTAILSELLYNRIIENCLISGVSYTGVKIDPDYKRPLDNYTNLAVLPKLIDNGSIFPIDVIKLQVGKENDTFIEPVMAIKKSEYLKGDINLQFIEELPKERQEEINKILITCHLADRCVL